MAKFRGTALPDPASGGTGKQFAGRPVTLGAGAVWGWVKAIFDSVRQTRYNYDPSWSGFELDCLNLVRFGGFIDCV